MGWKRCGLATGLLSAQRGGAGIAAGSLERIGTALAWRGGIEMAALALLTLALPGMGVFLRSKPGSRWAGTLEQFVLSKTSGYLMVKPIVAAFSSAEQDLGLRLMLFSFDDTMTDPS